MLEVTLTGQHVRLEPLRCDHAVPLLAAATESREQYALTLVPGDHADMAAYVDTALAACAGDAGVPFVVRDLARGSVVGSTRLFDFFYWSGGGRPDGAEIGHTWYAASAQRTACNTECKLLLLGHAFDVWGTTRVTLQTDARNARSRAAIERIGGRFEGIRRAHKPAADGGPRDSAMFSILRDEWPPIRAALTRRLEEGRRAACPSPCSGSGGRSAARTSP